MSPTRKLMWVTGSLASLSKYRACVVRKVEALGATVASQASRSPARRAFSRAFITRTASRRSALAPAWLVEPEESLIFADGSSTRLVQPASRARTAMSAHACTRRADRVMVGKTYLSGDRLLLAAGR